MLLINKNKIFLIRLNWIDSNYYKLAPNASDLPISLQFILYYIIFREYNNINIKIYIIYNYI